MALPKGVHVDKRTGKLRAVACVGRGSRNRKEKTFPAGTSNRELEKWQRDTETELDKAGGPAVKGSILHELDQQYLPIKAGEKMPTIEERERLMRMWVAELGPKRTRKTIEAVEIRAILARWHLAGWAGPTCNRARTALMDFFTVLGGRSAPNPVKDVPKYPEFRQPPPSIDFDLFQRIMAALPNQGQGLAGEDRAEVSKTKARLALIAFIGLPHKQIKNLLPGHIDWKGRRVYLLGRRKGAGTNDKWQAVSAAGMMALRVFASFNAWGEFSNSSMRISFRRAVLKAAPDLAAAFSTPRGGISPYKLRHLFGTNVLATSKDSDATSRLLIHKSKELLETYTEAAQAPLDRAALDAFDKAVAPVAALVTAEYATAMRRSDKATAKLNRRRAAKAAARANVVDNGCGQTKKRSA